MKKLFLSLFLIAYVTFGLTGCKSFVTSAPEQYVSKYNDAMILIEDAKGLIEQAKQLGMEFVTLIKQKNGTYAVKDNSEKESKSSTVPQGIMGNTSLESGGSDELVIPIEDIIRRTRVVH